MASVDEIRLDVLDFLTRFLPDRVIYRENTDGIGQPIGEDDNICKEGLPRATFVVSIAQTYAHDQREFIDDLTNERLRNLSLISVDFDIWRGDAMADAMLLQAAANTTDSIRDIWRTMGRSTVGKAQDISTRLQSRIAPRARLTMTGYAALTEIFPLDTFDHVPVTIDGNIDGGQTIEIPAPNERAE